MLTMAAASFGQSKPQLSFFTHEHDGFIIIKLPVYYKIVCALIKRRMCGKILKPLHVQYFCICASPGGKFHDGHRFFGELPGAVDKNKFGGSGWAGNAYNKFAVIIITCPGARISNAAFCTCHWAVVKRCSFCKYKIIACKLAGDIGTIICSKVYNKIFIQDIFLK